MYMDNGLLDYQRLFYRVKMNYCVYLTFRRIRGFKRRKFIPLVFHFHVLNNLLSITRLYPIENFYLYLKTFQT